MGLISPPKWPSVNPFSHPLGSKIGRKPMVNPSKWVNLKSNFLKFHHRNQAISGIEKARKMAYFRAFLALLSCRLSLAELRSATSGFEAVLLTLLHTRIAGQEASLLQDCTCLLYTSPSPRDCYCHRVDYRLLNCGARRAALRPYFLRSFIRGSLVR